MNQDAPAPLPVPKPHDLFALLGSFAREQGIALNDEVLVPKFLEDARVQLNRALRDDRLMHGTRAERQFEALVLTLGGSRLLKAEDQGRLHSSSPCRAPDYRIVLGDGEQWLVEVKNVHCEDPERQVSRLTGPYLASLEAYSDLVGVPLRLAHYWSRWQLWTIVDPRRFATRAGGARIEMLDALAANEFHRLGDVHFHTEPPIRLLFETAPTLIPDCTDTAAEVATTVTGVRLSVGGAELTEERSRHLAWILLLYGE